MEEIKITQETNLNKIKNLLSALRKYEQKFDKDLIVTKKSIEKMLEWMKRKLTKQNAFLFVAEYDGKIVGYIFGWIERRSKNYWKTSKYGYICDLFVKEEYRKKGIGKALLKEAEECFKKRGISKIFLEVYFDNPAREYYMRQGYSPIDIKMIKNI